MFGILAFLTEYHDDLSVEIDKEQLQHLSKLGKDPLNVFQFNSLQKQIFFLNSDLVIEELILNQERIQIQLHFLQDFNYA